MGAGHGHGHAGGRHRWRLAVSFALIASFFVVELVTALVSGSLALLSDAGHMAADVVALGAALLATRLATRKDSSGRRTYGSYRVEVFASLLAVLLMLVVAGSVVLESVRRIGGDPDIAVGPMVVVGGLGLLVNLVALLLLRGGAAESLNIKGAYLEVVADTAGSVGVLVAAGLITWTGESVWDVVVALAIGLFVAIRAVMLGRQVLHVLNQNVPAGTFWPSTWRTWRPSIVARNATKIPIASATTTSHSVSPVQVISPAAISTPADPAVSATTSR